MSSRALRKLHENEDLNRKKTFQEGNSDAEDGGPADLIVSSKKKKNFNCFDLLNEGQSDSNEDISQDGQSEENDETEAYEAQHVTRATSQKKKKKKKKNSKKTQHNACSSEDNIDKREDDIDRLIQEVEEIFGQSSTNTPKRDKQSAVITNHSNLLSIEIKNLNPSNELKKIFGSRTIQAEQRSRRGRGSRTLRSTVLISPKENWPQIVKQGISMQVLNADPKSPTFTFVHNQAYQTVEKQYLQAVASSVPDNIVSIFNSHPFHINGNLALSDLCRLSEDLAMAAELVERALYAYEHAFHPLFNIATGTCRLPYQRQVNRSFYVALLKHALYVGGRACYRTALELWKLLLSLDPDDDPLAVVLAIDFYAIRSSQYEWFIQFCDELESRRNLSQLPNMAYSLAMAKFLLAKKLESKKGSSEEKVETLLQEADKLLQEALIMFPSALPMILDKCSIQAPQHTYFTVEALRTQSPALEQLIKLYICRSYHVWKESNLLPWLEKNTNEVIAMVDRKDPVIADAAEKRARRYRGALPRNILRHIILCDLQEVTPNAMPANDQQGPILSLDPLPPPDSIDLYTLPTNRRQSSSVRFAVRVIQSLLPNYDVNQALAPAENAPERPEGEGEGNNDENNLFGMANNLHQSIQTLFLMASGYNQENPDYSDISDYDDEEGDDDDHDEEEA